ncbi:hypothetical protein TNCV_2498701 [Trichonephila clavipes]|nr:hypothetical protein TNCV_2498701 [Trichonephila clavipes]
MGSGMSRQMRDGRKREIVDNGDPDQHNGTYVIGPGQDLCGEGYAAEELRASSVTAPRNALPKAVPEDEELGCGWLGGGDSFISRNPPWLRPWTVPGSTLRGFPRCLALMNPPAVTLGTLEKCANSWPGGGRDGTRSDVKTIRKLRSGELFIEVSSTKQALALASLKKLAHFDIQYPGARRIVSSRTPVSGKSYAAATIKTTRTAASQTQPVTITTPTPAEENENPKLVQ